MGSGTYTIKPGPLQLEAGPSGTTNLSSLYTSDSYATTSAGSTNNEQHDLLYFGFEGKSTDVSNTYLNFDTDIPENSTITSAEITFTSNLTSSAAMQTSILGIAPGTYSETVIDHKDRRQAMYCKLAKSAPAPFVSWGFNNSNDGWVIADGLETLGATFVTIKQPVVDSGSFNYSPQYRKSGLSIPAAANTKVVIKYRVVSFGQANQWSGYVFWNGIGASRRYDIPQPPVGVWQEAVLDMTTEINWTGTITELSFWPSRNIGSSTPSQDFVMEIDEISVGPPGQGDVVADAGATIVYGINCFDGATSHVQTVRTVSGETSGPIDSVEIWLRRNGSDPTKTGWVELWSAVGTPGNYTPGALLATSDHVAWNSMSSVNGGALHRFFFSSGNIITWDPGSLYMVRLTQSFTPYSQVGAWAGYWYTTYWSPLGAGFGATTTTTSSMIASESDLPTLGIASGTGFEAAGYGYVDSELVRFESLSASSMSIIERGVGDTEAVAHSSGAAFRVDFPGVNNGIRQGTVTGFSKTVYPVGLHMTGLPTITTETPFSAPASTAGVSYSWGSSTLSPSFSTDQVANAVSAVSNHPGYNGEVGIKISGIDDGSTSTFATYRVWRSTNNPTGPGPTLSVNWEDKGSVSADFGTASLLDGSLSVSSLVQSELSSGPVIDGTLTVT